MENEYAPAKDATETAEFTVAIQSQPSASTAITSITSEPDEAFWQGEFDKIGGDKANEEDITNLLGRMLHLSEEEKTVYCEVEEFMERHPDVVPLADDMVAIINSTGISDLDIVYKLASTAITELQNAPVQLPESNFIIDTNA